MYNLSWRIWYYKTGYKKDTVHTISYAAMQINNLKLTFNSIWTYAW